MAEQNILLPIQWYDDDTQPCLWQGNCISKINISSKRSGNGLSARLVGNVAKVFNIFQLVAVFRGVVDFQESFLQPILTTLQSEVGGVMDWHGWWKFQADASQMESKAAAFTIGRHLPFYCLKLPASILEADILHFWEQSVSWLLNHLVHH